MSPWRTLPPALLLPSDFIFLPLSVNVPRLRDSSRVNGILLKYDSRNTHPGQTLHTLLGTHCHSVHVRLKTSPYNEISMFMYMLHDFLCTLIV